jgi:hypothetical protein
LRIRDGEGNPTVGEDNAVFLAGCITGEGSTLPALGGVDGSWWFAGEMVDAVICLTDTVDALDNDWGRERLATRAVRSVWGARIAGY